MKCGLLDPNHVIGEALEITCSFTLSCFCFSGEPYPEDKWQGKLLTKQWKNVKVYLRGKPLRAYTIILAKCPAGWTDGPMVSNSIIIFEYGLLSLSLSLSQSEVVKDISEFSYATTIGLAQFHELVVNQRDRSVQLIGKAGRPGLATVCFIYHLIFSQPYS
jgi:hypothetical protein